MKKTSKRLSTFLVGAAVAGLVTGMSTLTSCSGGDSAAAERNGCNGPNGCGGTNGCNGPNGCNGHDAKKEANGCNGQNGCKGHEDKSKKS